MIPAVTPFIKMSTNIETIEIALSKAKIIVMLLAALMFVALGCWFIINPPVIDNIFWGDPLKLKVIGYASVLFFGLCFLLLLPKIKGNKPGLVIDKNGFTDYSSAITPGQILWSEIEKIGVIEMHKQKLIMLYVKDPAAIIERQTNGLKRKIMQLNYNMYGAPVSISTNGLKISIDKLFELLVECNEQSKGSKNSTRLT